MRIIPLKSTIPVSKSQSPVLQDGEFIILKDQAGIRKNTISGWKVAKCYLTNKRLILWQLNRPILQVQLKQIYQLKTSEHYYVMRVRKAIKIYYLKNGKKSYFSFIANNHDTWKKKIHQAALLKITKAVIREIADRLDKDSSTVLWYLWEKKHATINELSLLCDGKDHIDLLTDIKDAINPAAQRVAGCPILSFERFRKDPESGNPVCFSWWLLGEGGQEKKSSRLLSIFDEDGYFQVILEVKKVEKSDLNVSLNNDQLIVESGKTGHKWSEIFKLPQRFNHNNNEMHLKNGLLEILIKKNENSNEPRKKNECKKVVGCI